MNGRMVLNRSGRAVLECWRAIPDHFANVTLGEMVVMPNHMHGIVFIHPPDGTATASFDPGPPAPNRPCDGRNAASVSATGTPSETPCAAPRTVPAIPRRVNLARGTPGAPLWQRSYHDHIIPDRHALRRIGRYIRLNPARWVRDRQNPMRRAPSA